MLLFDDVMYYNNTDIFVVEPEAWFSKLRLLSVNSNEPTPKFPAMFGEMMAYKK